MGERKRSFTRRDFLKLGAVVGGAVLLGGCNKENPTEIPQPAGASITPYVPEIPGTPSQTPRSPEATAEPSPTPDSRTYLEKYVYPALYDVVKARREEKSAGDTDFWHRVDRDLNKNRINFVMLGKGSEGALTDSMQILSLDIKSSEVKVVAIPRGVSVPEVSRYLNMSKIFIANQAYINGGIQLTEKVLEDATGISCDLAMVADMQFLTRAVDQVFEKGLEVCVPWEIDDINMGHFPAGLQTLNGEQILRLSRARYYGTYFDRDTVQQFVLKAMLRRAKSELSGGGLGAVAFISRAMIFLQKEQSFGRIDTNFDTKMIFDILGAMVKHFGAEKGDTAGFGMPAFVSRYEIETENNWYAPDTTRRRPIGGNPLAEDLVDEYWFASRDEVRNFLVGSKQGTGFEQETDVCGINE